MGGADAAEKSEAPAAAAEATPAAAEAAETAAAAPAVDAAPSGSDPMEVEADTKTKEEAVAAGAAVPASGEASAAATAAEDGSSKEQEGREEGGKAVVGDGEQGKKDEVESKGAEEAAANGSATAAAGKRPREENGDVVAQDGDKGAVPAAATGADGAGKKARLVLKDDVRAEVLRQMEYYFSDSNLPRDKFMKEKIQEGDGWVSLPLLCTFARMRKHLGVEADAAVPTHLVEAVADLLRGSSQLLRVSDDGQQVKREGALPLGREHIAEINARSLFAAPFEWCSSLEDVHSFFSKLGQVRSVTLRRHANSKVFRGSVFVEMGSEEEMRKVAAMKGLTHNGVEIRMEPKLEFVERVKRERVEGRSQDDGEDVEGGKKEEEAGGREGDKDEDADGGDRERDDDFPKGVIVSITLVRKSKPAAADEKEKAEDEGTKAAGEAEGEKEKEKERDVNEPEKAAEGEKMDTEEEGKDEREKKADDDDSGSKEESKEKAEEGKGDGEGGDGEKKDAESPQEADKGEGKGEPVEEKKKEKEQKEREDVAEGVTREMVRSAFEMYGNVKFVEYSQGRLSGFVRYDDAHSAQTALQKTGENGSAPLTLKGFSVIARVLNDEEEQEYWGKLREAMKNRHTGGRGGRGGRGRGWGGRGGGGGGWRGDRQDRRSGGRGGRGGGGWGGRGRGGRGGGGGGRSGHTRFDDDE